MNLTMNYLLMHPANQLAIIMSFINFEAQTFNSDSPSLTYTTPEDQGAHEEYLEIQHQVALKLALIALDVLIELSLKTALNLATGESAKHTTKDNIIKKLERLNIKVNTNEIDEIRVISNSIKHDGIVNEKLLLINPAFYPDIGREIHLARSELIRLHEQATRFLENLFSSLPPHAKQDTI